MALLYLKKIILMEHDFGPFSMLDTSDSVEGKYENSIKQIFDFCLLWLISSVMYKFMTHKWRTE